MASKRKGLVDRSAPVRETVVAFRPTEDELAGLERLEKSMGLSRTQVLRLALNRLLEAIP